MITWNQEQDTHTLRIATLGPAGYSFEHEKRRPEPGLGDSGAATTNQLIRQELADHDWSKTPLFLFVILQRVPSSKASRRERQSVWWMNLALLGLTAGLSTVFGVVP